ncbi:hypothetical protein KCP78_07700 [Salmonella enterica subsp. enterica]|nr:hypothetical protein KCP78_07700 [Salmonella enterica subsp. enterica]
MRSRYSRQISCRAYSRQLVSADQPDWCWILRRYLDNELAFYCSDVTRRA